jgi:hypothetical protein
MQEKHPSPDAPLHGTALRDLKLTIAGTPLEPVLRAFQDELLQRGLTAVRPHFYLSTEWGVPFGSISIAIPFYLARVDLTALHADRVGYVEGVSPADILRYLRHEMGHVVNYAYRLYETPEWIALFGDITQPYIEEYRPRPFHRDYVNHLPGWYAQKHPDEDWAETFAVWLTPGLDWRRTYAHAPTARKKLEYCDRTIMALRDRPPLVTEPDPDEDVNQLPYTLEQFYHRLAPGEPASTSELGDALQALLNDVPGSPEKTAADGLPVAALLRRLERVLPMMVYRWTGHFPERTRVLVRQLAECAEKGQHLYPADQEAPTAAALATFVTALAMNQVLGNDALSPKSSR